MIDLYPAIDLRGGRCVRLHQGDFDQETEYSGDPVAVAVEFAQAGVRWLHVVDLDAARTGEQHNRAVVAAIAAAVAPFGVRVQSGGGVRSEEAAGALAEAGVSRVVVGTAVLEDPALVERIARRQPTAVGLDGRGGEVAVRGWLQGSGVTVLEVLPRFEAAGVDAVIVTEIDRDGTLSGPDLAGLGAALARTDLPLVASGGVGSLDDLRALRALEAGGRRLAGIITGKALYEGRFTVAAGLAELAG